MFYLLCYIIFPTSRTWGGLRKARSLTVPVSPSATFGNRVESVQHQNGDNWDFFPSKMTGNIIMGLSSAQWWQCCHIMSVLELCRCQLYFFPGHLGQVGWQIIRVHIYTAYTAYIRRHGMQQRFLNITIVTLCECSQEISLWEYD